MRSDWTNRRMGVVSGRSWLAADHQDKDQGHFELWRGSDGLWSTAATRKAPRRSTTTRCSSTTAGGCSTTRRTRECGARTSGPLASATTAQSSSRSATSVKRTRQNARAMVARQRSVERFVRTFVYVRPSLLVIDDRVAPRPARHAGRVGGARDDPPRSPAIWPSAVVGASRVDIQMLEPDAAKPEALREPTPIG